MHITERPPTLLPGGQGVRTQRWAAEIFDRLRAANGGKLTGFFRAF